MIRSVALAAILFPIVLSAQTIRRVNNTPGISVPYTTIDGAITAASPGDVILVEGSATDYTLPANYTLTKPLTIQGPGFALSQNPGYQANTNSATVSLTGSFIFGSGSEGSVVSGMVFRIPVEIRVSDIIISHNGMYTIVINNTTPCKNLWIHGNYPGAFNTFGAPIIFSAGTTANTVYTNVMISNNILNWRVELGSTKYGTFTSNSIYCNPVGAFNLSNFITTNNIFSNINSLNLTNAMVQNNVFCGTGYYPAFDPGLNNMINVDVSNVYGTNVALATTDRDWMLKSGSPVLGAGINGIQPGAFGGSNPYRVSCMQEGLPALTGFNAPATIPQNVIFPIKVNANAN